MWNLGSLESPHVGMMGLMQDKIICELFLNHNKVPILMMHSIVDGLLDNQAIIVRQYVITYKPASAPSRADGAHP